MSYPYPQDRHLDRTEKGEQPYKDARQAMAEMEASIQAEAEAYGEAGLAPSDEERMEALQADAADRLQRAHDARPSSPGEQE